MNEQESYPVIDHNGSYEQTKETNSDEMNNDELVEDQISSLELISDEVTLKKIGLIFLLVGIISSIILFFTITIIDFEGEYSFQDEIIFSWSGLIITLGTLFLSIALWAFFRVIANISISLKKIEKSKL